MEPDGIRTRKSENCYRPINFGDEADHSACVSRDCDTSLADATLPSTRALNQLIAEEYIVRIEAADGFCA